VVKLPEEALAQLQALKETLVQPGDIWGLPAKRVVYRGPAKARYCLVAAVEGGGGGARAHLIPGTTQAASGPAVVVEVGETELIRRTEFDFSVSFAVPVTLVTAEGRSKGRLPEARVAEIAQAVAASNLVALKRLVGT
jgi:hypothetical protein